MNNARIYLSTSALLFVLAGSPVVNSVLKGAESKKPSGDDEPTVFKLTLEPQAEPQPPLKYRLLPAHAQTTAGDASLFYHRAIILLTTLPKELEDEYDKKSDVWLKSALADMPREEIQGWLDKYEAVLEEVKRAANCDSCNWDLRIHELKGTKPIELQLPELHRARWLARILQVKARYEIAGGQHDDAVQTLCIGYKLGFDVAGPRTLINDLVGIAICILMNDVLQELIDAPGAPNLYWALTGLPRPMIDMRPAMEYELNMPMQIFPFLGDAETANRSPAEWERQLTDAARLINKLCSEDSGEPEVGPELRTTKAVLDGYATAKKELIHAGYDRERVEAMPVGQVIAIQSARAYRYSYQQAMKWTLLPYWQGSEQLKETYRRLESENYFDEAAASRGIFPVAGLLMPATDKAILAGVKLDRQIATLQTIEAIRIHAAAHDGQLPKSLVGLRSAPAPIDPVSGKSFPYQLDGKTAILEVPAPAGRPASQYGRRYEITIVQP